MNNNENGLDDARAAWLRQDYETAIKLYRPLAEKGNSHAQTMLGLIYAIGLGVKQNNVEAVTWYRKAADQGRTAAQYNLGGIYAHGSDGVEQDEAEALKLYHMAAAQGFVPAYYELGKVYAAGELVKQDFSEAYFWVCLAINANQKRARVLGDNVAKHLTAEQIKEVQKRVSEWKPTPSQTPDPAAPPETK
jgi:uncharacterized protein